MIELVKKFLHEGGITSWMTFVSGILLLIIAAERIYFLYFDNEQLSEKTIKSITDSVLARNYNAAIQVCNSNPKITQLKVIKAGLMAIESGREAMNSSLGATIVEISKICERRVPIIALIASAATLLGLLGTISGMIRTFDALATAAPDQKAAMLGAGIAEAMNSTAAGLMVGIAAMVFHTLCTVKIDEIIGLAQKTGFEIIALVEKSERGA